MAFVRDHIMADIAAEASRSWTDIVGTPSFIKNRENAVFRVAMQDGASAALRLHRPDYHSAGALKSELDWMTMLADAGLPVPRPITTSNGRRMVCCGAGGTQDRYADLLEWMDGEPLGETGKPLAHGKEALEAIYYDLGAKMARLHTVSDRWTPPPGFRRHSWDHDGLLGERPFWGRFWENGALSNQERLLIEEARRVAGADLIDYARHGDYGLIHADLIRENVLIKDNRVRIIDFDDAGFGWRLFDIATALHHSRAEPAYPFIRTSLIDGYRSGRRLSDRDLDAIPLFTALRSFTYLGWIATRMDEHGANDRLKRFVATALVDARNYLNENNTTAAGEFSGARE